MAEITAALVKELRDKTGAGMMDCKKALEETGGNLEEAVDWLRKKGISAAAKKAGRVASEGLVAVADSGNKAAVVEVNAETDFVARNEQFQDFAETVAGIALETGGDVDALKAADYPGAGRSVEEQVTHLVATIGENLSLRRSATLEVEPGVVSTYVHNALKPGLGKIGVIVALESSGDSAKLSEFGKQLAMHVAASAPQVIRQDQVPQEDLDRERDVLREQAEGSGKPAEVVDKMVEGRLRKYYEEVCLLDQAWVMDGKTKVGKIIEEAGKEAGGDITVKGFVRFALGEGIEKKEEDFAAEVAAAAGSQS